MSVIPPKLPPPAAAFKPQSYRIIGPEEGNTLSDDVSISSVEVFTQHLNESSTSLTGNDQFGRNSPVIDDDFDDDDEEEINSIVVESNDIPENRKEKNINEIFLISPEEQQNSISSSKLSDKEGATSPTIFATWDKSWSTLSEPDLSYTRDCFSAYCIIFSPIPHPLTKLSGITVPLKVVYLLWHHVLTAKGCELVEESIVKVMTNLSQKMGFMDIQKVYLGEKIIECVSFSHELYRNYGKYYAVNHPKDKDYKPGFVKNLFKSIGVFSLEKEVGALLKVPKPINETYYYIMLAICYLHNPKTSNGKPQEEKNNWYLFQPQFIKSRLETLGILHGTLVSLSDIEQFCDDSEEGCTNILQSFECIASHLHAALNYNDTTSSNHVEIGMEIARSFESMANSLSRRNRNPMKYHHEALAVYEELLDDSIGINRTPLKDILQLDMAETLQNLGNCIAFEGRGFVYNTSISSSMNHMTYMKTSGRTSSQQEQRPRQMNHKAMKFYDRAFQVRRVLLGNHHPLLANTLQCIGVLYFEAQLFSYAVSCFLEALRIRRLACEEFDAANNSKKEMELSTADTLEWIGHAYREMKKFHSSITALSEALVIQSIHCGNEHEDVAALHQNIGVVYDDLKEYQTSLGRYGEALRIRRYCLKRCETDASDRKNTMEEVCLQEGILETLCCMGNVYTELENTNYALECYREAMSIKFSIIHERFPLLRKWHLSKDDSRVLPLPMFFHFTTSLPSTSVNMMKDACLTTLTSVYAETELHDDFLEEPATKYELLVLLNIMARVVELTLTKYGSDHMYVCNAFFQMADIYLKTANYNKASKCLEEVLRILGLNTDVEQKKEILVRTYYQLAMCSSRLGKISKAMELYGLALEQLKHEKRYADCWLTKQLQDSQDKEIHRFEKLKALADKASMVANGGEIIDITSNKNEKVESFDEEPNYDKIVLLSDIYYNLGNAQSSFGENYEAFSSLYYSICLRYSLHQKAHAVKTTENVKPSLLDSCTELNLMNTYLCMAVTFILCTGKYDIGCDIMEDKILPVYKKILHEKHSHKGHLLYYLGQTYQGLAVFDIIDIDHQRNQQPRDDRIVELLDKSLSFYNQALEVYRYVYPKDHLVIAHVYHSIGTIYDSKSEFTKAMRCFKDTLRVYLLYNNRGEHMGVSIVLNHLGIVCAAIEEDEAALKFLLESYAVRVKILGDEHVTVADSLHNLGAVYAKLEKYTEAMHCFKESLKIRIEVYGELHLLVAKTYDNMGLVHSRLGEVQKAMERFEASLKIRQLYLSPDDEDMACTYYNIGSIHARTGEYDMAVDCFRESLRIRRILYGNDHVIVANILHSLGIVFEGKSDTTTAKRCYTEALEVKKLRLGDDDISVASTLSKVGNLELSTGELHQALVCFEKALNVQRSYLGHDHVDTAVTLSSIGDVWVAMESYSTAMQCYEESLRVRELKLGENHEDVASSFYSMGKIHDIKGDFEDAMLYYGNAYRIYNRSGRRRYDKHCRRIVEALRTVVANSNGQVGIWDTFIVTGDGMILIERMILDLVELLRMYMIEPSSAMIKGTFLNTLKQISELATEQARISKLDAEKYQRAITDCGGLLDEI